MICLNGFNVLIQDVSTNLNVLVKSIDFYSFLYYQWTIKAVNRFFIFVQLYDPFITYGNPVILITINTEQWLQLLVF